MLSMSTFRQNETSPRHLSSAKIVPTPKPRRSCTSAVIPSPTAMAKRARRCSGVHSGERRDAGRSQPGDLSPAISVPAGLHPHVIFWAPVNDPMGAFRRLARLDPVLAKTAKLLFERRQLGVA